jgi:hypothetical protein
MNRKTAIAILAVVTSTIVVAVGAALTPSGSASSGHASAKGLVGTWDVIVSLPGQPPGRVLATFDDGGTTVETAAVPGTIRGSSHGAWKRIGHRLYAMTRVFFRFEGGVYVGTTKVRGTIRVAPGGQSFDAVSVSELRDPAGNLIRGGIPGTAAGTRINVEEIPDTP